MKFLNVLLLIGCACIASTVYGMDCHAAAPEGALTMQSLLDRLSASDLTSDARLELLQQIDRRINDEGVTGIKALCTFLNIDYAGLGFDSAKTVDLESLKSLASSKIQQEISSIPVAIQPSYAYHGCLAAQTCDDLIERTSRIQEVVNRFKQQRLALQRSYVTSERTVAQSARALDTARGEIANLKARFAGSVEYIRSLEGMISKLEAQLEQTLKVADEE
jgi:hypothetical protein